MSHHSQQDPPEEMKRMIETMNLGATGKFPQGKLTATDEGEIRLAIGCADGKVLINFGKPTAWIGFTRAEALNIAETLIKHAATLPTTP
jgi:hypothetical protein